MVDAIIDTYRDFQLTFKFDTYLKNISRYEQILYTFSRVYPEVIPTKKIFKPNQIKLFLNLVLKAGVVSYLNWNGDPHILHTGDRVCVWGDVIDGRTQFKLLINEREDNSIGVVINDIERHVHKRRKVYAKMTEYTTTCINQVDLNHYNIPPDFFNERNLPKYLNHPILGIYVKEMQTSNPVREALTYNLLHH